MQHDDQKIVDVTRSASRSAIVLVCEHASDFIPLELNALDVSDSARHSHAAFDPGALNVAKTLSKNLDAVLVASCVSRLVYDCNRPPHAPDAMPVRSEAFEVPGNVGLDEAAKLMRVARYYTPFQETLTKVIAARSNPVIVTIHSFTPVYNGQRREVEIGILHDSDRRLADAMLHVANTHVVRRNAPYGPEDGVTHTLKEHAIKQGRLNVMIEVRNDLIADEASQVVMATTLTGWITQAVALVEADACKA